MPGAAIVAVLIGLAMLCAAVADGGSPPESIPLPRSRVATPISFPTTPPIRATPMFVSTEATPFFFSDWHLKTLMRGYMPPRPTPDIGMP